MNSREERERLKEEYKEHFRKLRDARKKVSETVRLNRIQEALKDMGAEDLMDSLGNVVDSVKEKVALVEAKLELALESFEEEQKEHEKQEAIDEFEKTRSAKTTIQQIKMEMGQVVEELEKEASQLQSDKTLGRKNKDTETEDGPESKPVVSTTKTIGKQK
jgi:hypothetical protein